jgi:hypothetical protein
LLDTDLRSLANAPANTVFPCTHASILSTLHQLRSTSPDLFGATSTTGGSIALGSGGSSQRQQPGLLVRSGSAALVGYALIGNEGLRDCK